MTLSLDEQAELNRQRRRGKLVITKDDLRARVRASMGLSCRSTDMVTQPEQPAATSHLKAPAFTVARQKQPDQEVGDDRFAPGRHYRRQAAVDPLPSHAAMVASAVGRRMGSYPR